MKSQKHKRQRRRDMLVPKLVVLVVLVLVIFEGPLVVTMITHHSAMNGTSTAGKTDAAKTSSDAVISAESETEKSAGATPASTSNTSRLAGLSTIAGSSSQTAPAETEPERLPTVSDPDSPAIVSKVDTAVDDSYFADAAFIGDSRMEGFRNASGITQGRFFTSVGMSTTKMANEPIISTADGNITVAAALSGDSYGKIYIMLGANDLGEYDWNSFHDTFVSATRRFRELQPDALIYICSCIYVDESKVTTSYVNNENVDILNEILLQICEEEGYYYLDLNEFLSDGQGALLSDASSDGVHLYEKYCKQMLEYLKNHYIEAVETSDKASDENVTEASDKDE